MIVKIQQGQPAEYRPQFAASAYLQMIIAMVVLVVPRIDNTDNRSMVLSCLHNGSVLGFCIYGVYASTAAAILKDFEWQIWLQDTLWGTFVYGATPMITFFLLNLCGAREKEA